MAYDLAALEALTVRRPGFRIGASFRVIFSADGTSLVTLGKRVTKWDVASRARTGSAHPFPHESELDISPDGRRMVVKNTVGDVVVLEMEALGETLRLRGREYGEGSEIRFSPCGEFIVDGSWAGDLLVRSASNGQIVLHERGRSIDTLVTTGDRAVWLYLEDGTGIVIRHWPFGEHDPVICSTSVDWFTGAGKTAAISNDGQLVATTGWERVDTWQRDGDRLELRASYSVPNSETGTGLSWNASGTRLAYAGAGGAIVFTPDLEVAWRAAFDHACDVAFAPGADLLAVGDWSRGAVVPAP